MVKIIADSTCDLSHDLLEKYDISIIPLRILLGDSDYEDGKNITPDDIYMWSDKNRTTPKTSAPAPDTAVETIRPFVESGYEVICFTISESMSTTANVLRLAARELDAEDKVYVVDSANLSTGIGLLVIEAAIMAQSESKARKIVDYIEDLKPLVRASFVVDTLTYLYRGGRCSGLAALAGGALKLHPRIDVIDGKMLPGKKYRGRIEKVIMSYAGDLKHGLLDAKRDRVFITHSKCDEKVVESVAAYLRELGIFKEILVTNAGGVISSHCGPGTLGILYIADK